MFILNVSGSSCKLLLPMHSICRSQKLRVLNCGNHGIHYLRDTPQMPELVTATRPPPGLGVLRFDGSTALYSQVRQ